VRILFTLFLFALLRTGAAQSPEGQPGGALSYSRSVNVALNAVQLHDKALEAWTWTFGKEPGARLLSSDRTNGSLDATARFNFRSVMLTMREETMGVVQYKVTIRVSAGECRVMVTDLSHTGNRNTTMGGIHVGALMRATTVGRKVPGMSRSNALRLQQELQEAADDRIKALLNAFEARLRANAQD
jgi:hypothetical protein